MNLGCINTPSSNHPFLLIFKNMSFETMVQTCHVTQPKFMKFLPGIGINHYIPKQPEELDLGNSTSPIFLSRSVSE